MEKYKKLFLFGLIIIVSCESEIEKQEKQQKLKQNSIDSLAVLLEIKAAESAALDAKTADSITNYKETLDTDKNKIDNIPDIDESYSSNIRISFDRNKVDWKNNEKNEFRFIYKQSISKLIVYKNNNQFKTFEHTKISTDLLTIDELTRNIILTRIVVNGKKIFYYDSNLNELNFAPNGINNYSQYYILIPEGI